MWPLREKRSPPRLKQPKNNMRDEDNKKEYELSFLSRTEEGARQVLDVIKAQGADVSFESPVNKITLAYKIEKESTAFFGYFFFSVSPQEIKPIDEALKIKGDILRFLIITPPFAKNSPRAAMGQRNRPQRPAVEKPAQPLSNEALEKKIEEILNK